MFNKKNILYISVFTAFILFLLIQSTEVQTNTLSNIFESNTADSAVNSVAVGSTIWYINSSTSWDDLHTYLPSGKMSGTAVWVKLVPPSKSPLYSEPYRNDYIRWAQEIARLSLRYSNLKGYSIENLQDNINQGLLTSEYIESIKAAANSLNSNLMFLNNNISSNTYWVSVLGHNNNPGNYIKPFSTIQHAYSVAQAGDTIMVKPGVYNTGDFKGEVFIYLDKLGTSTKPIVIKSEIRGGAIIDCQQHNIAIYFNKNYNILDGFRITNAKTCGVFVNSSYNKIVNCEIDNNGITGNTIYGQIGIFERSGTGYNSYLRNYVHHNGRQLGTYGDQGIYLCGSNDIIAYNICSFNASYGIQLSACTKMNVFNNTFVQNGSGGLNLTSSSYDININSNVFYHNDGRGYNDSNGYGLHLGTGYNLGNIVVRNNLFSEAKAKIWNFGDLGDWSPYIDTSDVYLHSGILFVDDTNNFSFQSMNQGVNNGVEWGQTGDFYEGMKYGDKWDIGAIEYRK